MRAREIIKEATPTHFVPKEVRSSDYHHFTDEDAEKLAADNPKLANLIMSEDFKQAVRDAETGNDLEYYDDLPSYEECFGDGE